LSKKTVSKYVQRLKREKIQFLHGYPSAILNLMRLMKVGGYSLDRPLKAIFLISENFTQSQTEELERFFSCKVMSFYGHSERLIIAPSYGVSTNYRVDQRYGFFELIEKDGEAITTNTIEGEMVGTSFDNYAMPLIRYRTGDYTSFVDAENQVVSGVAGRWGQQVLFGLNNEEVTLTALNVHSDVFSRVTNYQFVQKRKGEATIRVLPRIGFSPDCEQAILKAHQVKVNGVITFSIEKADRLTTSVRGKYLRVVNS
jgi:phenylacetate-CoA ligase